MGNKQKLKFEFMRGFVAIAIAIAVAFIFIFICADDPAKALNCLLIRPIISNGAIEYVFYFDYFGTYDTHYLYRSGGLRYVLCKPVQPCW